MKSATQYEQVEVRNICARTSLVDPARRPTESFVYVDVSSVSQLRLSIETPTSLTGAEAPSRARKQIRHGDVLFATIRPTLRRVALVPPELDGEVASTAYCVLRPITERIDPRFLFYAVSTGDFVTAVGAMQRGASYPAVTDSSVLDQKIPLPPLAQQRAICVALDSIRQSISVEERRQACLGELKAASISRLLSKGTRDGEVLESPHGAVPARWRAVQLRSCATIQTGITKGRTILEAEAVELPYLRVANVQDGYLDLSEMKTIQLRRDEVARYSLRDGDVVLTEGGDFDKLGRGFIWRDQIQPCVHQNHVFVVRVDRGQMLPAYFAYLAQSPYGKRYFLSVAHKTTNLACINASKLGDFPVPVPSLDEQSEIVSVLEEVDRQSEVTKTRLLLLRATFESALNQLVSGGVSVTRLVDQMRHAHA